MPSVGVLDAPLSGSDFPVGRAPPPGIQFEQAASANGVAPSGGVGVPPVAPGCGRKRGIGISTASDGSTGTMSIGAAGSADTTGFGFGFFFSGVAGSAGTGASQLPPAPRQIPADTAPADASARKPTGHGGHQ